MRRNILADSPGCLLLLRHTHGLLRATSAKSAKRLFPVHISSKIRQASHMVWPEREGLRAVDRRRHHRARTAGQWLGGAGESPTGAATQPRLIDAIDKVVFTRLVAVRIAKKACAAWLPCSVSKKLVLRVLECSFWHCGFIVIRRPYRDDGDADEASLCDIAEL